MRHSVYPCLGDQLTILTVLSEKQCILNKRLSPAKILENKTK